MGCACRGQMKGVGGAGTDRPRVHVGGDELVVEERGVPGLHELLAVRLGLLDELGEHRLGAALGAVTKLVHRLLGPALELQLLRRRVGADHKEPLGLGGGRDAVVAAPRIRCEHTQTRLRGGSKFTWDA